MFRFCLLPPLPKRWNWNSPRLGFHFLGYHFQLKYTKRYTLQISCSDCIHIMCKARGERERLWHLLALELKLRSSQKLDSLSFVAQICCICSLIYIIVNFYSVSEYIIYTIITIYLTWRLFRSNWLYHGIFPYSSINWISDLVSSCKCLKFISGWFLFGILFTVS